MVQRPPAGTIPDTPGSYQFKDADGRVIYVGKAHSLRQRLSNYFGSPSSMPPRTAQMVAAAESVDWIQVRNDVEALMLEYSLIKQHRPRFNIRLRDDKSYPFLAITTGDEWPRAMVMRGKKRKGVTYFGPYGHAYAIRETLDLLLRTFPIRTCSDNKFRHHERLGRPCLLFHIEKCTGPCVKEVEKDEYDRLVGELIDFLCGETQTVVRRLEQQMKEASDHLEFERAARLRDRLASVRKAIEKQAMVTERPEDLDVIGVWGDDLEASVQVFYVRKGRVMGRKGFVVDKVEDVTPEQLVGHVLEGLYYDAEPSAVPREVLVPDMPDDPDLYREWLSGHRGSNVGIRVPQRGDKRALQAMVTQNAKEEFVRHRLKRASDHNARARALNALQEALDLPDPPLRIECFDMSHIQGSDYVGSMVVMEDGLAKKSDYRRFKIRDVPGNDDFAAMEEVLTRRLTALLAERDRPVGAPGRRKFAYPPNLLVVDGGKGQLSVALKVVEDLGLEDEISVAALAKRFEEVFVPGQADPVRIPRQSEALYLLQRLRDEAHRFAITYHRQLRGKRMTRSSLDGIPGLGPTRKQRLVKELGGVAAVKS
ncbi:MAG: excinuclease ABC subunit UvrC, partial [Acidimicrobiales bacterium]